jgi:hypothetical protein
MRASCGLLGGVVLVFVLVTGQAQAQIREVHGVEPGRSARFQAGADLQLALPQGEFSDFVNVGGGVGGWFAVNLDRRGTIALRFDGSWILYGQENRRRPLSTTVPFVTVDVTTSNNIYAFGIGPLITLGHGPLAPYLNGSAGFSYFATESGVSGTNNGYDFAHSTNFDDFTFSWSAGGGLRLRVGHGRTPVFLNFASEYHQNGQASYLREGSIIDNGNGTISFAPIQSETNLLVLKFGVSGAF